MAPKIMFLGLGVVPQSLMNLLLKEKLFDADDMIVVDQSKKALDFFIERGGKKENVIETIIGKDNYLTLFDYLEKGDFLIDLVNGTDEVVMTLECAKRGIHFICTSDGWFEMQNQIDLAYEDHFRDIKEISRQFPEAATTIEIFGINSGVINVLIKKALMDIVEQDNTPFVSKNREHLRDLIKKNEFARLAQQLQVTYLVESDLDVTQTNIAKPSPNTVYSTWNAFDFNSEMNDRATMIVGTETKLSEVLERINADVDQIYSFDPETRVLELNIHGKQSKVEAVSANQMIEGCMDDHEEIHSIRDYFSVWDEDGDLAYAPSVMFVYRPCDIAYKTVLLDNIEEYHTISKEETVSGGEIIGMLVEGANFTTRYIGTELYVEDDHLGTPVSSLVGISIYAGLKYIMNHPNEGILYPEALDADEIISYISPYLPVISKNIDC